VPFLLIKLYLLCSEVGFGSSPVVLRESELEVILYNLATEKEKGGVGIISILDSCIAVSLACVRHKCVRITSEFVRLFVEPTCLVVRCYPDTDQSA
jgi:hypothetical protein